MAEQNPQSMSRARLEEERASLEGQLGELATDNEEHLEFDENFADSAQVAAELGENRELAGTLRKQLDDVDAALARLDDGTYGDCANCGKPIEAERLEAMPATAFCISCA